MVVIATEGWWDGCSGAGRIGGSDCKGDKSVAVGDGCL